MVDDIPSLIAVPADLRDSYYHMFNLVKPLRNWRDPINKVVSISDDDIKLMKEAISIITGSRDIQIEQISNGQFQVTAEGYYNACHDRK